jgi:hypothetical protein
LTSPVYFPINKQEKKIMAVEKIKQVKKQTDPMTQDIMQQPYSQF